MHCQPNKLYSTLKIPIMNETKGIYIRNDLTELISERFVKHYDINLRYYTAPFGYFSEKTGNIICNGRLPDGTYILIGTVSYPGTKNYSKHTVFQFNVLKSAGKDLRFAQRLAGYPDKPEAVALSPEFPLFRIGERTDYKEACKCYFESISQYFTIDELFSKITKLIPMSIEDKIYRFRIALQREMDKGKTTY